MVYDLIFRTEGESEYLRDPDSGLWIRKKGKKESTPRYYLGSIDSDKNDLRKNSHYLIYQIKEKHIPGFTPAFIEGYDLFGVSTDLANILAVGEEMVILECADNLIHHLGGTIGKICEGKLPPPWEEQIFWKEELERRKRS